jgi:hypothetical protein
MTTIQAPQTALVPRTPVDPGQEASTMEVFSDLRSGAIAGLAGGSLVAAGMLLSGAQTLPPPFPVLILVACLAVGAIGTGVANAILAPALRGAFSKGMLRETLLHIAGGERPPRTVFPASVTDAGTTEAAAEEKGEATAEGQALAA